MYILLVCINFIIFFLGTIIGSIVDLIVDRIVEQKNLWNINSYCDNCKHKLNIFEIIPIFSYVFLGGKCKHCKKKINIEHFFKEIFTGILFLVLFNSVFNTMLKINNLILTSSIFLSLFPFIWIFMDIIKMIDKKEKEISVNGLFYGTILTYIYLLINFLFVYNNKGIHLIDVQNLVIYFIILIGITVIQLYLLKKDKKIKYYLNLLIYIILLNILFGSATMLVSIFLSIIYLCLVYSLGGFKNYEYVPKLDKKVKSNKKKMYKVIKTHIPYANIVTFFTIVVIIIDNYIMMF